MHWYFKNKQKLRHERYYQNARRQELHYNIHICIYAYVWMYMHMHIHAYAYVHCKKETHNGLMVLTFLSFSDVISKQNWEANSWLRELLRPSRLSIKRDSLLKTSENKVNWLHMAKDSRVEYHRYLCSLYPTCRGVDSVVNWKAFIYITL